MDKLMQRLDIPTHTPHDGSTSYKRKKKVHETPRVEHKAKPEGTKRERVAKERRNNVKEAGSGCSSVISENAAKKRVREKAPKKSKTEVKTSTLPEEAPSPSKKDLTSLQSDMKQSLDGARFR